MESIKFRHLYHLSFCKIILACCFVVAAIQVDAQFNAKGNYNFMDFQSKPYYFGITFGLNNGTYKLNRSSNFINNDSINIVHSLNDPGFNIHLIANIKIGDYFDFRILPGFSFMEHTIQYTGSSRNEYSKTIESVNFETPLLLRFKSAPYKDKRLFVITGVKYSYDVVSNSRVKRNVAQDLVQISPHDFSLEFGAGIQFFFPYFIFSPEIKFSQGISNRHIFKDSLNESRILDDLLSQVFTISFHFEG